ncbi:IS21 family transposase, partial [Methylobacterium sp. J-088]|nr:IS21 family transposase [Methylobacterium sp. J-088]
MEVYAAVRQFVFIVGHARRSAARVFGLKHEAIANMCRFSLPPRNRHSKPIETPNVCSLLPAED